MTILGATELRWYRDKARFIQITPWVTTISPFCTCPMIFHSAVYDIIIHTRYYNTKNYIEIINVTSSLQIPYSRSALPAPRTEKDHSRTRTSSCTAGERSWIGAVPWRKCFTDSRRSCRPTSAVPCGTSTRRTSARTRLMPRMCVRYKTFRTK